jgi:hypothetical protein
MLVNALSDLVTKICKTLFVCCLSLLSQWPATTSNTGNFGLGRLARHQKILIPRGYGPGQAVSTAPRGTLVILVAASEAHRNT